MIEIDQNTYTTGKPCKRGHLAPRWKKNGDCIECCRERRRSWYRENREADLARKAKWIRNNRERKCATDAAYYQKNRDKRRAQSSGHYAANRDAGRAARRAYRQHNLEKMRADGRARYAADPERMKVAARNHKARRRAAAGTHTAADVKQIARAQGHRCAYCRASFGKVKRHVDHIVPLALGGTNDRRNIQLLCAPCNLAKRASDPIEFARRSGRLL